MLLESLHAGSETEPHHHCSQYRGSGDDDDLDKASGDDTFNQDTGDDDIGKRIAGLKQYRQIRESVRKIGSMVRRGPGVNRGISISPSTENETKKSPHWVVYLSLLFILFSFFRPGLLFHQGRKLSPGSPIDDQLVGTMMETIKQECTKAATAITSTLRNRSLPRQRWFQVGKRSASRVESSRVESRSLRPRHCDCDSYNCDLPLSLPRSWNALPASSPPSVVCSAPTTRS